MEGTRRQSDGAGCLVTIAPGRRAPGSSRTAARPARAVCLPGRARRARAAGPAPSAKLDRGEDEVPFVVPGCLLRVGRLLRRGVLAPLELGLAVLQADPHHVPPPPRIRDQSNNLASPTVLATATRKGASAQGHRKFCACGVAGPKILVARGGSVLAPDSERAPIFLAVAPHGGRVAAKAVRPPCRARRRQPDAPQERTSSVASDFQRSSVRSTASRSCEAI